MAATAAYNQQRELAATPAPTATTGAGGLAQVPEGVMNAHLIASRVPVLPDDAHAKGVTGVVRIQATINRSGYVSRLHVLQGPTELRPAALTAVSAWRYRPYLVDGQPVDVVTTITVDFSSFE
jgi:protein TonB